MGDTKGDSWRTGRLGELFAAAADDGGLDAVLLAGDNLSDANDETLRREFIDRFEPLLSRGVPFFASLGNHDLDHYDSPAFSIGVPEFHMAGRRYYAVSLSSSVEVFLIDSTSIEQGGLGDDQVAWLSAALTSSEADVKIAVMHHPIYGFSGPQIASESRRALLEPLFIEHGVALVFQGHQHIYERLAPQNGIHYFIVGAGGGVSNNTVEQVFPILEGDDDHVSGMLWEIEGDTARFRTIASDGDVLDEGTIEL